MSDDQAPTHQPLRLKFGIRQLLYATALIASGLALHPGTLPISLLVLFLWGFIFATVDSQNVFGCLLFYGLLAICLLGLLLPSVQVVREAHPRSMCRNNMKQIVIAILNYESSHGHFPTDRVVVLSDGTELRHSWRIEILPYIEQQAIYDAYDFNEPWNGPNNSKLADMTTSHHPWRCPSQQKLDNAKTTYRLVGGPGTAFESEKKFGTADVKDGLHKTIALVEHVSEPVNWMKPGTLSVDEAVDLMNSVKKQDCAHVYDSMFNRTYIGLHYVHLDGAVNIRRPNPPEPIKAGAFLIADGEQFESPTAFGRAYVEWKYHVMIALAIYLGLIAYPMIYIPPAHFSWSHFRNKHVSEK